MCSLFIFILVNNVCKKQFFNRIYMSYDLDKEIGDRFFKIVDEVCLLLADYNGRFVVELEDRIIIFKMLVVFIQFQKDKLVELEKKFEVSISKEEFF